MTREIRRPIVVIGTGRSGSSWLFRLIAAHPDTAWMTPASRVGWWAGRWTRFLGPSERYEPLRRATGGVFTLDRPLTRADITPEAVEGLRRLARRHLGQRRRFVMKITGFPRVAYLDAAFPDARFVHLVRDKDAVVASLLKVDWWRGEKRWMWGPMDPDDARRWEDSGRSDAVLAGIYWETMMRRLRAAEQQFPNRVLRVHYADLIADEDAEIERIFTFCGLDSRRTVSDLDPIRPLN